MDETITSVTVGIPVPGLSEATEWYGRFLGPRPGITPAPGIREFETVPRFWLQLFVSEELGGSGCARGLSAP